MNVQPVSISKLAQEEILKIMQTKNIPEDYGLRIGIKGAVGCAGYDYLIGFDKKKDQDLAYNIGEIPVYLEKKHTMYLMGLEVDFHDGADARGFTFKKPFENEPAG